MSPDPRRTTATSSRRGDDTSRGLRPVVLDRGRRFDRDVQRAGQPRAEQRAARRTGRRTAPWRRRAGDTRWTRTAAPTAPPRRATRASGTPSTRGGLGSTCSRRRGATPTWATPTCTRTTTTRTGPSSRAEYKWLANDLATHPRAVSFAFLHFPMYSDNSTETSDTWLTGSTHLEGLLGRSGVDIVFNGHAHIYERNRASATGMPVTYVTGGGGGELEPVSRCSSIDQYAIGWSYSSSTHGSACGAASRPSTIDRVFHFLLVTVSGTQVTVTPHRRARPHLRREDLLVR